MKKSLLLLTSIIFSLTLSAQFSNDVAITLLSPAPGTYCDGSSMVTATVSNMDAVNPTNGAVMVELYIDGIAIITIPTSGPLAGGGSEAIPLGPLAGKVGKHTFSAVAVYPGDINAGNNSLSNTVFLQFNGTYTIGPNINDHFSSLKMAVDTINTYGLCGPTVINCQAGHTETNSNILLNTLTTSAANTLTFNGNGAIITSANGISALLDGILKVAGTDYVTVSSFTFRQDPAAANKMEWGVAILKQSGTEGSQNITIEDCIIRLDRTNTGSTGIYSANHTTAATTALTVTAFSGTNSNLHFYNNTIDSCFTGIQVRGYNDISPFNYYDHDINIGAAGKGNSITNYGFGGTSAYAITTLNVDLLYISHNTMYNGAGCTSTLRGIYLQTASNSAAEVNHNTISLNSGAAGSLCAAIESSMGGSGTGNLLHFHDNIIKNCTYTSGVTSGAFYGIYCTSAAPDTLKIVNNRIDSVSHGGTGILGGIYSTTHINNLLIDSNTVSNITRVSGSSGATYGIRLTGGTGYYYMSNNQIFAFSGDQNVVYGLASGAGTENRMYNNRVYNLQSTGVSGSVVHGIFISAGAGSSSRVFNNFVSDLNAPNVMNTNSVIGININAGPSLVQYNTVYLNATTTTGSSGSSAIMASTTPNVTLNNNILVNVSAASGLGYAVAYRRSNATLTSYNAASNNNCFYVNASANSLIYVEGTSTYTNPCATVSAFKTYVGPRDAASFSELPPFVNILSKPYDLHLQTTIPTACESGGIRITSPLAIPLDFDKELRQGETGYSGSGIAPDVGADEGDFVPVDLIPPLIVYTALPNTLSTSGPILANVIITDDNNINVNPGLKPRVYYKKKTNANTFADNTSGTNGWKYVEASGSVSPFSFALDFNLISGGVIQGDTIQYFVVAQDSAFNPNVGINNGVFAAVPISVDLTSAAFPLTGTINYYAILEEMCGTYYIGASQTPPHFTSLTAAVSALNSRIITCPVVLELQTDYDGSAESLPLVLNQNDGSGPVNTLTIRPASGVTKTIEGNSATSVIKLSGFDYFILDGSNNGSNSRDLSLRNSLAAGSTACIWLSSNGASDGCHRVSIKNCNISTASNTSTSTFGIYAAGINISTSGSGANNDSLSLLNNSISNCWYGIFVRGNTDGSNEGLQIDGNIIGSELLSSGIGFKGIDLRYADAATISRNEIFGLSNNNTYNIQGIDLGEYCAGSLVEKNEIHGFRQTNTGGYGAYGIHVSSSNGNDNIGIINNIVYDLLGDGGGSSLNNNPFGIRLSGGDNMKVWYNSVHLSGSFLNPATADLSAAMMIGSSAMLNLDLRNNVFSNSITGGAGTSSYAIWAAASLNFGTVDYNDYYAGGPYAILGGKGSDIYNLTGWQSATLQDVHSLSVNPGFTSDSNLLPLTNAVNNKGIPLAGITEDFFGTSRNPLKPDLGAIEFIGVTYDLSINMMIDPVQPEACFSNQEIVRANILNNGIDTLFFNVNPVGFHLLVDSDHGTQAFVHLQNTNWLAPDQAMIITLTNDCDLSRAGIYRFTIYHDWAPDQAADNDTLDGITRRSLNPEITATTATPPEICYGSSAQLMVSGNAFGSGSIHMEFEKDSMVNIPDNDFGGAFSPIQVSGTNTLARELYAVNIDSLLSPSTGDLSIFLYAPDGSSVELSTNNGGSGANYIGTTLGMWAISPITIASPPFTGEFVPEGDLTTLTGSSEGTWRLKVADVVTGNTATLYKWSLTFRTNSIVQYEWWPNYAINDTTIPDPVVNPLILEAYYVRITDEHGCTSATDTILIDVAPLPSASITANDTEVCLGSNAEISFNLGGVGPYLLHGITIDEGASTTVLPDTLVAGPVFTLYHQPGEATWYHIEMFTDQNSGCSNDTADWVMVDVLPVPVISLGNDTILCADQSILLDPQYSPATYLWSDNTNASTLLLDSAGYGTGTHIIWVRVEDGCTATDTILVTFDPCTAAEVWSEDGLMLFPNPAQGECLLYTGAGQEPLNISIMDLYGRLVWQTGDEAMQPDGEVLRLDIRDLAPGKYLVSVVRGKQKYLLPLIKI